VPRKKQAQFVANQCYDRLSEQQVRLATRSNARRRKNSNKWDSR